MNSVFRGFLTIVSVFFTFVSVPPSSIVASLVPEPPAKHTSHHPGKSRDWPWKQDRPEPPSKSKCCQADKLLPPLHACVLHLLPSRVNLEVYG